MSQDQDIQIQIEDLSTEKSYFTQIPNIVLKIGLTPFLLAYYITIKSIAGEGKFCFMNQQNLADLVGCSVRKIRDMDKELSQPFDALGGKPLIKVQERKNEKNEKQTNLISIVDIWGENFEYIAKRKIIQKVEKDKIKISPAPHAVPPAPHAVPPAPYADKQEPLKKIEFKKTTTTSAEDKGSSSFFKERRLEDLEAFGFEEPTNQKFYEEFDDARILKGIECLRATKSEPECIEAWLYKACKEKWEPSKAYQNKEQNNREFVQEKLTYLDNGKEWNRVQVVILTKHIEFICGQKVECIGYDTMDFMDKLKSWLRRIDKDFKI